jgi:hypothetical protein
LVGKSRRNVSAWFQIGDRRSARNVISEFVWSNVGYSCIPANRSPLDGSRSCDRLRSRIAERAAEATRADNGVLCCGVGAILSCARLALWIAGEADVHRYGAVRVELGNIANDLTVPKVVVCDAWEKLLGHRNHGIGIVKHR